MLFNTTLCIFSVLSALECTDWQGKTFLDGTAFYPKQEDPCYQCHCDKGYTTMCKTVSCAPPKCAVDMKPIEGECCQFQCIDKNGVATKPENNTGIVNHGDVSGRTESLLFPDQTLEFLPYSQYHLLQVIGTWFFKQYLKILRTIFLYPREIGWRSLKLKIDFVLSLVVKLWWGII